jgi:periplasmic copper chaperone A
MDFPLSVQVPGKAGDKLTFKALQTYSNGQVVRWIGGPGAEEPAPQVAVTAAQPEGGAPASSGGNTARSQPATQAADNSDKASKGLGIVALILGGLGLVLGAAALVLVGIRRRAAAAV